MNNEPVAWMNRLERLEYEQGNGFEIPLYTAEQLHPAKTLTDEEIKQIFGNETGFDMDSGCFRGVSLIDFAREILRKAQEK